MQILTIYEAFSNLIDNWVINEYRHSYIWNTFVNYLKNEVNPSYKHIPVKGFLP
jgi:hypothetical protein